MRPTLHLAGTLVALCACGGTQTVVRPVAGGDGGVREAQACTANVVPVSSPLRQRLELVASQLQGQGVRLVGFPSAGFITRGALVTVPIDTPTGRCLTITVLASSEVGDLDARIFTPDGENLVEDVAPDPHPTVQLCTAEPRRVYFVLDGYNGEGTYAVATYESERPALPALASALGSRGGVATDADATQSEAARRLGSLRAGILRRGFVAASEVVTMPFSAPGRLVRPLAGTGDRCYTVAAVADEGVTNTNVQVFDEDGELVARDIRPDRDGLVQYCPSAAEAFRVEVGVVEGAGKLLFQLFSADAAALGGANTLWLGERMEGSVSVRTVAEASAALRTTLTAQGFAPPAAPPARWTLAPSESRELVTTLEPGRCHALAAALGRGLGRTTLAVYDTQGNFLARGRGHGASAVAVVCPTTRLEVRAALRAEVGAGDVELAVYTLATPGWSAGADPRLVSEALAVRLARAGEGYRAVGEPDRMILGSRAIRTRPLELHANQCTRVELSAGAELPEVGLRLKDASGHVALERLQDGSAGFTRCPDHDEQWVLEGWAEPPEHPDVEAVLQRFDRQATTP